jgi:hypothetical protein
VPTLLPFYSEVNRTFFERPAGTPQKVAARGGGVIDGSLSG